VQAHTYDAEMGRTGGGVFNTTHRYGTNSWHGTGFYQTRPIWAEKNNFFSEKAGVAKPNNPYYLGGGGFGGPIVKNRTFSWVAREFTDKESLTGFYLYNAPDEPCAIYFGTADQTGPNRFADPLDYLLIRRPKVVALNNTWVLSDSSVMALRFGMTRFPDNNTL